MKKMLALIISTLGKYVASEYFHGLNAYEVGVAKRMSSSQRPNMLHGHGNPISNILPWCPKAVNYGFKGGGGGTRNFWGARAPRSPLATPLPCPH